MHTLDGLVFPYIVVWILRATIMIFGASLAALFLGLGLHKRHVLRAVRDKEERILFYAGELVALCAGSTTAIVNPRNFRDALCLAGAFRAFSFHDESEVAMAHMAIAVTSTMVQLRRALLSKDWGVRTRALTAFGELRDSGQFEYLRRFAEQESVVRVFGSCLAACAALIQESDQFRRFSMLLNSRPALSASYDEGVLRTAIRSLLGSSDAAVARDIMHDCLFSDDFRAQYKAALISAAGKEHFARLAGSIVAYAHVSSDRIIHISAMRALFHFGMCDDLISRSLDSDDPVVQVVAIRSSMRCNGAVETQLAGFLGSPHFDVRYAAAMTLAQLPSGERQLRQVQAGSDGFARDMAQFALSVH